MGGLVHRVRDFLELAADVGAQRLGSGDDHDSDEGSDQAVFNGRGAGFVFDEAVDELSGKLVCERITVEKLRNARLKRNMFFDKETECEKNCIRFILCCN